MDHRKTERTLDRHGRARAALLVLVVGLLAAAPLASGCRPPERSVSAIEVDIADKEARKKAIEDELKSYGGHYDKDEDRWQIDYMGPLTRGDTREHIRELRTEWRRLDDDLYEHHDELRDAHERAAQHVADQSRDAGTGTTGVPPHMH